MLRKRAVSALLAIAMVLSCLIPLAACGASAELSSIEITTPLGGRFLRKAQN